MIELRWAVRPGEQISNCLEYRYRIGGIGMPVAARPSSSGLQMSQDEGWSPWTPVRAVHLNDEGKEIDPPK